MTKISPEALGPPRGLNGLLSGLVKRFRIRAALAEARGARSFIDLGSGLCEILSSIPADAAYTGVERDRWMYERGVRLFPGRAFVHADVEDPRFALDARADVILLLAVWEHLRAPEALLVKAREWVRPRGRFILTTPAPASHRVLELGSRLGLLSRHADEEHERLWTIEEIADVAARAGWRVLRTRTFLFGLNQLVVLEPV